MSDQFDGYKKLLALAQQHRTKRELREAITAAGIAFDVNEPLSGYYRLRRGKDGPLDAVAIWREEGTLIVLWGDQRVSAETVWPHAAWMPVSFEWFSAKLDGKEWPDVHDFTPIEAEDEESGPAIGHNNPPEATESSILQGEISEARAGLRKYEKIETDDQAKAAQSLRSKLNELAGKADKLRKKLKQPHKDAADAVDAEWMPIIGHAKTGADLLRASIQAWENAKLAREQEEQAKRDAEAETAAEAAEAALHKARLEGTEPPTPPPPPPEPPPTAPQTTIKGGTGRAAHVSTVKVIDSVTDWTALFNYFREDNDVRRLLFDKANKVLKLNPLTNIPGVKIKDERKVA